MDSHSLLLDQATQLRRQFQGELPQARAPRPRIVAFVGGKGGVGVTTLVVTLGRAMAAIGQPAVLVDADFAEPHLAERAGASSSLSLHDAIEARIGWHDALCVGLRGEAILAGDSARRAPSAAAIERLAAGLASLGDSAANVFIDAGHGAAAASTWAPFADLVALITTPDPLAVAGAYALVKTLAKADPPVRMGLLVNRVRSAADAEVADRMALACWRFQARELPLVGLLSRADARATQPPNVLAAGARLLELAARAPANPTQSSDSRQPIKSTSRVTPL